MAATTTTIHAILSVPPPILSYLAKIEDNKPLINLFVVGKTDGEQKKLYDNKFDSQIFFPLNAFIQRGDGAELVLNFKKKNIQMIVTCQQAQGKFQVARDNIIDNSLNVGIRVAKNQPEAKDLIFIHLMKTRGFSEVTLEEVNKAKAKPNTQKIIDVKLVRKQEYSYPWIEYVALPKKTDKEESKKTEEPFSKETEKMFKGMFNRKA